MNLFSLTNPAALANALGTKQHEMPSLRPLRRIQIAVVTPPPVLNQTLLLSVQGLKMETITLGDKPCDNLLLPRRKFIYLRRGHRHLANRVANFLATSLALISNLYLLTGFCFFAAYRRFVRASERGLHLFIYGGVVWFYVFDTHRAAPSSMGLSRSACLPTGTADFF